MFKAKMLVSGSVKEVTLPETKPASLQLKMDGTGLVGDGATWQVLC